MEHYDPEMARRVWQRVQGYREPPVSLSLLAAEERENAVKLQQLSRQFKGHTAALLRQMAQKEEDHCRFLLAMDQK